MDLERGTVTDVFGLTHNFSWSRSNDGRGRGALGVGKPDGPCPLEGEFLIRQQHGQSCVLWPQIKGQSRWWPDKDEDELDHAPRPDAFAWGNVVRLILEDESLLGSP